MQDDSSLPLDVNTMSALPEYHFWGKVVVVSFSTCMVNFSVTLVDTVVLNVAIALTTKPLACGKILIASNITQSIK